MLKKEELYCFNKEELEILLANYGDYFSGSIMNDKLDKDPFKGNIEIAREYIDNIKK